MNHKLKQIYHKYITFCFLCRNTKQKECLLAINLHWIHDVKLKIRNHGYYVL